MLHNSRSNGSHNEKDNKKLIFDRIQTVENYFGELCTELSSFTKKKARLRDKYDELSRVFKHYADAEEFNETLSDGLTSYSKALTLLGDIKELEVQRLQSKVVRELASYEGVCKNTREIIKHSMLLRDKENNRRHHLDQIKQRSENRSNTNANKTIEVSRSVQELEQNIIHFERQKLEDVKKLLLDLTMIQLKEQVKSMEILTATYQDIAAIDVDKDLEEFSLKCLMHDEKMLKNQMRAQSMSALSTMIHPPMKPNRHNLSNSTTSLDSSNRDIVTKSNGKTSPTNSSVLTDNSDSDDGDTTESEEEDKTTSEDDDNDDAKGARNTVDNDEDEDNTAVVIHSNNPGCSANASTKVSASQSKSSVPVPQVRFSKITRQIDKK